MQTLDTGALKDIAYPPHIVNYSYAYYDRYCFFFQKNVSPEDDIEEDILEAEEKRKRDVSMPQDPDEIKTYDATLKTNHYESQGAYTLELIGQRRLRRKRRENPVDLSNTVESSLLSFINHSEKTNITCTLFNRILDIIIY